jgi:hypothetical protein
VKDFEKHSCASPFVLVKRIAPLLSAKRVMPLCYTQRFILLYCARAVVKRGHWWMDTVGLINTSIEEKTMERALLWMKCAAMHDPVRPVLKRAAAIGWEAKHRRVELVIERAFKGEELLLRMKGWVTADVAGITHLIKQHGKLRVLDETDLVVETKDKEAMEALSEILSSAFGQEVWLEPVERPRLE